MTNSSKATRQPVLLVGGAGYIGSHVAKYLHQQGYLPVVYDNFSRGHREFVKWGPSIEGSTGDEKTLLRCIEEHSPVAAMHFAAFAYVEESVRNPSLYYRNNVAQTVTLLDALVAKSILRVVFSSSCASYGVPLRNPIVEEEKQNPINPYGRGKAMVEQMLEDYDVAYGLRSVALRYFNAAGADPDGEIGEWHNPETHLIPLLLDAALGLKDAVSVFGDDYPTSDGTCIRDYVHVTDIAQAHHLALEKLLTNGSSEAFNLGNGKGYSVKEVVAAVERVTGQRIALRVSPRRLGDPPNLVGSAVKIQKDLGWNPRFGSLDTIIETAWKWHRKLRRK